MTKSQVQNVKITKMKDDVTAVTVSQDLISNEFEIIKALTSNIQKEHESLNAKINEVMTKAKKNEQTGINLEQYTRHQMVEINGMPQHLNEDVNDLINKLIDLMSIKFDKSTVDVIHRLSDKS